MANEAESPDERMFEVAIPPDKQTDALLNELAVAILTELKTAFPAPHETAREENDKVDDAQEVELTVRNGLQVGVGIKLLRDPVDGKPDVLSVGIEPNTKLAQYVTLGVTIPFMLVAAYMAIARVPPLDFLPGRKIAALLGALIGFVFSLPVFMGLNYALGRSSAPKNRQLVSDVATRVEAIIKRDLAPAAA
jgi:hypothetical protein